jgi:radical SAM superfamily enzyme YgiQ (UPF0313 family)
MGKKLLLINPVTPNRVGLSSSLNSRFPPLGLGMVAALTPGDWEIEIADENFDPFAYRSADLVGLSAFTASVNRAYELAALYRRRAIPTVLGGIHATMMPDEALQFVDSVVIGEAETAWPRLVADFEAGRLQRSYRGTWSELAGLPQPRRDLLHPGYRLSTIQTARGCPMDCVFCSVTGFNGHRHRQRPVDEVLDELEAIPQKNVLFADDNLIGRDRQSADRAAALFQGILARGIRKNWFCQASLNFADRDDVLESAARSGCRIVFLGIEAENEDALVEVNKRMNLSRLAGTFEKAFRRIQRHGIAVLGSFIYGMDSDTSEALQDRTEYIRTCGVDVIQRTCLTPLPGTQLFARMRAAGRLLYDNFPADWRRYDMTEVVHRPLAMAPSRLAEAFFASTRPLFGTAALVRRFFKTWMATRSLRTAAWAYAVNLVYRKVAFSDRPYPPANAVARTQ